ncbi:hypothetical protein [Chryseobacterium mucoviscidosis]|uniref:Uncharacterized protein n=1 Tax=Chryseobacterium mucoviscidosis TaxID=1945581 RepID=A0A202BRC6_9FLAO|nr:hypothetical protein [Chryseobacterium mucoviscidosis]OVE53981.1 hypothetical protein B0E34_20350 [Chryseobacterium mucoviscidosis]
MKIKIIAGLILISAVQTISAQIKTLNYNMIQVVEKGNLTDLIPQKAKITIDNIKKTVSIKDSELLKPYIFKIDPKSRCDNFGKFGESVSCFLRSREDKLYIFSYNKNRLEIMNLAGDGTRYINIK